MPVSGKSSLRRLSIAVALGLLVSVIIWIVTPYNNFVLRGSYMADSFMPPASLAALILVILFLNPLLRRFAPRYALTRAQMSIIFGMTLVACVLPGQGLHRMLPHAIARVPQEVRENPNLAEMHERMGMPSSIFPDRIGYGAQTPVSDAFIGELGRGESIPWGAWVGPALAWGSLLAAVYLMMVGVALIVWPQWRNNERLAFPLLSVQQQLIEPPEEGKCFGPLFRKRSFWVAALSVLALHSLTGLQQYYPDSVPAIPLSWALGRFFTEQPLNFLPGHIHTGRLFFIFLGVAYFMPNRIGFSVWAFVVGYAAYTVIGHAYAPPFYWNTVRDHRVGGMLALFAGYVWLGRGHWWTVIRSLFWNEPVRALAAAGTAGSPVRTDRFLAAFALVASALFALLLAATADLGVWAALAGVFLFVTLTALLRVSDSPETQRNKISGWMYFAGCLGMFGWFVWVGVTPPWALFFVAYASITVFIITRIVAETGMPFIRLDGGYQVSLVRMAPFDWLTPAVLYVSYFIVILFQHASRVSAAVLAIHAIGMDREATPRRETSVAFICVAVLLIGFVVCGAVHLMCGYHHSVSLDGLERPISSWGVGRLSDANSALLEYQRGEIIQPPYNQVGHLIFGAALAVVLQILCMRTPRWPLHPIGLLMVHTFYSNNAWVSIFLGWLLKVLILRYGGVRVYRAAQPAILGLIMGEVFAAVVWGIEPVLRLAAGHTYVVLPIQPY